MPSPDVNPLLSCLLDFARCCPLTSCSRSWASRRGSRAWTSSVRWGSYLMPIRQRSTAKRAPRPPRGNSRFPGSDWSPGRGEWWLRRCFSAVDRRSSLAAHRFSFDASTKRRVGNVCCKCLPSFLLQLRRGPSGRHPGLAKAALWRFARIRSSGKILRAVSFQHSDKQADTFLVAPVNK